MEAKNKLFIALQRTDFQAYKEVYDLGDEYFQSLEDAEVEAGKVNAEVNISKIGDAFNIEIAIKGVVKVPCDRCLGLVEIEVENEGGVKVGFSDADVSDDEDWIVLDDKEEGIDVTWLIYEVIALALPMQRLHADGECDEEMLNILSKYSVSEAPNESDSENVDPRWEALKKLKN